MLMNPTRSHSAELTDAEITVRARELWHARGCPSGQDDEIWFEARRLLDLERTWRSPTSGTTRDGSVKIDDEALAERLDDFGDPGNRSVTSADRPT